jgi:hypothetical protein
MRDKRPDEQYSPEDEGLSASGVMPDRDAGRNAAIRANRRGRIAVAAELVDEQKIRALLSEHVSLISCEPDSVMPRVWLHGYSDDFDALPLGAAPPQYQAIFSVDGNGEIRLLGFQRATE